MKMFFNGYLPTTRPVIMLFGILTLVLAVIAPSAFATNYQVSITAGAGSDQSCVTANNCFNPSEITIGSGDTVTWSNGDKVGHTVTSGKPSDNLTGTVFDSSLIKAGGTYSFTFPNTGTYDYFCMVHPWMTGEVSVGIPLGAPYNATANMSAPQAPTQPAPPSQAPQYGSQAPSTSQSGQGQQGGIPLGGSYSSAGIPPATTGGMGLQYTDANNPTGPLSSMGWAAGLAVAAVMSGIGVWAAVRRH